MEKPGTMYAVSIIRKAFITKVKKPNVIMLMGKVSNMRIGFKNRLRILKTTTTIAATQKFDITTPPDRRYPVTETAKVFNKSSANIYNYLKYNLLNHCNKIKNEITTFFWRI